jgi:2-polyprenyl-3-methyl-5-hydroxy-6-metoxy-1,4-benzoquinol methylase
VRAPEKGLPRYETITVEAPNALGSYDVDVYSLNLETEEMPDELKEFDLVLMWEILEHLCADPAFMIWQGLRTLKKGGVVCLTTPNALWHFHTINHIFGVNSLGLRLQLHIPFWTHWRLYSPAEVREMFESMGCKIIRSTTFLRTEPYSWKSRLFHWLLEFLRRNSGNGTYSLGLYVYIVAQKESDSAIYRPDWLYPQAVYHR